MTQAVAELYPHWILGKFPPWRVHPSNLVDTSLDNNDLPVALT